MGDQLLAGAVVGPAPGVEVAVGRLGTGDPAATFGFVAAGADCTGVCAAAGASLAEFATGAFDCPAAAGFGAVAGLVVVELVGELLGCGVAVEFVCP